MHKHIVYTIYQVYTSLWYSKYSSLYRYSFIYIHLMVPTLLSSSRIHSMYIFYFYKTIGFFLVHVHCSSHWKGNTIWNDRSREISILDSLGTIRLWHTFLLIKKISFSCTYNSVSMQSFLYFIYLWIERNITINLISLARCLVFTLFNEFRTLILHCFCNHLDMGDCSDFIHINLYLWPTNYNQ